MNGRDPQVTRTWKDFLWETGFRELTKGLINLHSWLVTFQYTDVTGICEGHWYEINTLPLILTSRGLLLIFCSQQPWASASNPSPSQRSFRSVLSMKEQNANSYWISEISRPTQNYHYIYNKLGKLAQLLEATPIWKGKVFCFHPKEIVQSELC